MGESIVTAKVWRVYFPKESRLASVEKNPMLDCYGGSSGSNFTNVYHDSDQNNLKDRCLLRNIKGIEQGGRTRKDPDDQSSSKAKAKNA